MSAPLDAELAARRERSFDPELERQKYAWMGYGALTCGLLACTSILLRGAGAASIMAVVLGKMLLDFSQSPLDTEVIHARKAELVRANPKPKIAAFAGMSLGLVGLLIALAML